MKAVRKTFDCSIATQFSPRRFVASAKDPKLGLGFRLQIASKLGSPQS